MPVPASKKKDPYSTKPKEMSVDVTKPVIMAEIAPGHYNLIDGRHRVEKARRLGMKKVPATN